MSIDLYKEMFDLIRRGTLDGRITWTANHDRSVFISLVGHDVFELHRIEENALLLRHQNLSYLLLPETDEWVFFNAVLAKSVEDDDRIYSARKTVVAAVTKRLHAALI